MAIVVQLADEQNVRFVDHLTPLPGQEGGHRRYYKWTRYAYRIDDDQSLTIMEGTCESWYHGSGEHRDMTALRERPIVRYRRPEWTRVLTACGESPVGDLTLAGLAEPGVQDQPRGVSRHP